MKTILHPTDFSESSNYALTYAVTLSKEFEAKLYIVHVIETVTSAYYYDVFKSTPPVQLLMDIESSARKALEQVLPPEVRGTIPTEYLIRHGSPFLEIIRCAKEIEADLIVLGTHGRAGLKHLIFGSVAENVVRKSSCPVLSVRHPTHKFEMPV